jgi:hypothetical protein
MSDISVARRFVLATLAIAVAGALTRSQIADALVLRITAERYGSTHATARPSTVSSSSLRCSAMVSRFGRARSLRPSISRRIQVTKWYA